jgi:peptide/nickel transport system ATP-binding protein
MNAPAPQAAADDVVLDIRDLKTCFPTPAGPVMAVDGVSISLRRGRILGLVGESGSGKSVLGLSIMRLLAEPGFIAGGEIRYGGVNLAAVPDEAMRRLRGKRIAMIFQDPMMTLNPVLRIETQMVEAILAHENVSREEARKRSRDALGQVGIPSPEERLRAYPHQFSGGMRQRVSMAIALLHRPDVIIADEPTTALDVTIQSQILSEVQSLVERFHTALIWITHDLSVVSRLADDIAVMYAGRIVELGTIDNVVNRPSHPYTAGLINSLPSRNRRGSRLQQIPGMTPSLLNLPQGCSFRTRCRRADDACIRTPELLEGPTSFRRCFHPLEGPLQGPREGVDA